MYFLRRHNWFRTSITKNHAILSIYNIFCAWLTVFYRKNLVGFNCKLNARKFANVTRAITFRAGEKLDQQTFANDVRKEFLLPLGLVKIFMTRETGTHFNTKLAYPVYKEGHCPFISAAYTK